AKIGRTVAAVRRRRAQLGIKAVHGSKVCESCLVVEIPPEGHRSGAPKRFCTSCLAARARAARRDYYRRHPEKSAGNTRRWRLLASYGMTPGDYDRVLAAQGGVCALCGTDESDSY